VADPDPPFAEDVPCAVVGRRTGTAPAVGSTRALAPTAMGRATVRTTGLASEGTCWIVLAGTDEISDTAASVTGTTEAVDPATAASGTLPATDWTPGNDGGSGSALAPAGRARTVRSATPTSTPTRLPIRKKADRQTFMCVHDGLELQSAVVGWEISTELHYPLIVAV
jgi:hypothetical protein